MRLEKFWRDFSIHVYDDNSVKVVYKTWGHEHFASIESMKEKALKWIDNRQHDLIKELDAMRKAENYIRKMR